MCFLLSMLGFLFSSSAFCFCLSIISASCEIILLRPGFTGSLGRIVNNFSVPAEKVKVLPFSSCLIVSIVSLCKVDMRAIDEVHTITCQFTRTFFYCRQIEQLKRILTLEIRTLYFHKFLMPIPDFLGCAVWLGVCNGGCDEVIAELTRGLQCSCLWVSGKAEVTVRALHALCCFSLRDSPLPMHSSSKVLPFLSLGTSLYGPGQQCIWHAAGQVSWLGPSGNTSVNLDAFVRENYNPDLSIQSLQLLSSY